MLEYFAIVFRVILGWLFVLTGLLKLPDLKGFYVILLSYNLLPTWFARISAYTLPLAEIFAGVWLMTGLSKFYAASFVLLLLLSSTFVILAALIRKQRVENCGCYGTLFAHPVTWGKLMENLGWIVVAVIVLAIP